MIYALRIHTLTHDTHTYSQYTHIDTRHSTHRLPLHPYLHDLYTPYRDTTHTHAYKDTNHIH